MRHFIRLTLITQPRTRLRQDVQMCSATTRQGGVLIGTTLLLRPAAFQTWMQKKCAKRSSTAACKKQSCGVDVNEASDWSLDAAARGFDSQVGRDTILYQNQQQRAIFDGFRCYFWQQD